jgi:hypothetical protein
VGGHNFILDQSWFPQPIPDLERAEIGRRQPSVSLDALDDQFGLYLFLRDSIEAQPKASALRDHMIKFAEQISGTLAAAQALSQNNLGAAIRRETALLGHPGALEELVAALIVLSFALPRAISGMPVGNAQNPRHVLAVGVADIVRTAGLPVNKKPNGPFCLIMRILLEAAGESPSNIVEVVKPLFPQIED